ncbi:MAG: DNA mismatch repair endonuclease MutL [Oscillospiraceae bacterium]|jgi:DNA mismatch repair protein MutL|nr:DNA mismatch repair endonuclease MutL [Oscillospiraceae bacterium]
MSKITLLNKHTAELIAAGEVVERPASVVKELVENAIDAGSRNITIEIKNGGVTLIRVTDDGEGIAREDVPTAFLRHATSKVHTELDLEHIATLGFRGEALASVSAVSRTELLTRRAEELAGTHYVIEGGSEALCEDAGCPVGTTIMVKELFYNTPARMKFLKKDVTEANAVAAVLDRIALSHPEISLSFIRDGKEALSTPGSGDLKACIYAVFGKQFAEGLIPLDYSLNYLRVSGFISKPHCARPNRSMQNFFINGRYVKSRTMQVALEEAFKRSIMVGKFPACALNLEIPLELVDVNVHPAKTEVRFENEKPVFDVVFHGVKAALNKGDTPPELQLSGQSKPNLSLDMLSQNNQYEPPAKQGDSAPPLTADPLPLGDTLPKAEPQNQQSRFPDIPIADIMPPKLSYSSRQIGTLRDSTAFEYRSEPAPPAPTPPPSHAPANEEPEQPAIQPVFESFDAEPEPRIIGEAFDAYIIMELQGGVYLIDKHAAHERMLYEQLIKDCDEGQMQYLLEPVTVRLERNEYNAVIGDTELAAQAGFELDDFGDGTVLVRAIPPILAGSDIASAVMELAGYLTQNRQSVRTEHLEWIYHSIACRAAVKAGNKSNPEELAALVRDLLKEPELKHCPHGRPIYVLLTKREIEKRFGRQ